MTVDITIRDLPHNGRFRLEDLTLDVCPDRPSARVGSRVHVHVAVAEDAPAGYMPEPVLLLGRLEAELRRLPPLLRAGFERRKPSEVLADVAFGEFSAVLIEVDFDAGPTDSLQQEDCFFGIFSAEPRRLAHDDRRERTITAFDEGDHSCPLPKLRGLRSGHGIISEDEGRIDRPALRRRERFRVGERGVQLVVTTDDDAAISEPVAIPAPVLEASGFPVGVSFLLPVRPYRFSAIDVLDLHLPVFAGRRVADDRLEPASPYIYGTAFPVWHGGLFATAAHVVKSAVAAGEVVLGRLGGPGPGIPGYGVERAEIFEEYDLALLKCPGLEKFPPVTVEMQNQLAIFDEVCAVGYPFSVDPEHLIAIHRGFSGHIVASRQLYRLRGQPFGYELSFPTPPGMSGAPLIHRGQDDVPRCYGYIVEQADTEFAGVRVSLGIAVSTAVFRSIRTQFLRDKTFSDWFGVPGAPPPPRHEPRRPSGMSQAPSSQVDDWPDEGSEPLPKGK